MIKLATCFSGIGAIEHALNRMGLDNEIVFACDNGDVDVLSKEIPLDIEAMKKEFNELKHIIKDIDKDDYRQALSKDLNRDSKLFDTQLEELHKVDYEVKESINNIFDTINNMDGVNAKRKKEYSKFQIELNSKQKENELLYILSYAVEITNDFHKDNSWDSIKNRTHSYKSETDHIDWLSLEDDLYKVWSMIDTINGRRVLKNTRDICERLGMLHEKIVTLNIHSELAKLDNYDDRKAYIDNLYKGREKQNKVKESYMANYKISDRHFHWNVSFLDGNEYKDQVDLFVGGSPCQSFSLVGKQRGLEDTRGTLFYEYARLVKEIRPKVFIYENVRALLSNDEGRTWETIQQVFTSLDYTWFYKVLNAKDYGIPQNRERVFVVGFRNDLKLEKPFKFPEQVELKSTMQDYLLDNVAEKYYLPPKGVDFVTSQKNIDKRYTQINGNIALCQKKNQQFNWHGDFVCEIENTDKEQLKKDLEKYFLSPKVKDYVLKTGTKGFYSRPEIDLEIARPLLTTMHKMHRAGVDNYVTTEGKLRKLTPRECLRLMGFSDSFKIAVSDTAMYQQAGNSIVVNVLMNIMHQILESYPELED